MGKILSIKNCHSLLSAHLKVSRKESTTDFILYYFLFHSTYSFMYCLSFDLIHLPAFPSIVPWLWRMCQLSKKKLIRIPALQENYSSAGAFGAVWLLAVMTPCMWFLGKVVSEMPQVHLYSGVSHKSFPFSGVEDICVQCCSHSCRGCTSCPTICQWGATSPSLNTPSRGCDAQRLRWGLDSFPR